MNFMNRTFLIIVAIVIVFSGLYFLLSLSHITQHALPNDSVLQTKEITLLKNATYVVEGESVTLVDGKAQTAAAPGSASKITTQYLGYEVTGDLNNDGIPDAAFILTQNSGGSGTFYYAVAAIKIPNGFQGTAAVLLGDRIAVRKTQIKDGILIVNYADRNPDENFAVQPSVVKTIFLKLNPATMKFNEVVQKAYEEPDQEKFED